MNANNATTDTFSSGSNAQRENLNAIFTSEKLDKSDDIVYAVNKFTINKPNILNKTQRPQGMHKAILHTIQKKILALATEMLNKKY